MPGLSASRCSPQPCTRPASSGMSGRGPTRLISPRSTFHSWGSSSRQLRRSSGRRVSPAGRRELEHLPVAMAGLDAPASGFRSSASAAIVRNLWILNRAPATADARLREKSPAPASPVLIASATSASSGDRSTRPSAGDADVQRPLEQRRRAREARRRQPEQRHSLHRMDIRAGGDELVEAREHVDLHVEVAKRTDRARGSLCRARPTA